MRVQYESQLRFKTVVLATFLLALALFGTPGCSTQATPHAADGQTTEQQAGALLEDGSGIPAYSGSLAVELNGNAPDLTAADAEVLEASGSAESYAPLDELGRCGAAIAVVSPATMPPAGEERGSIGMIKPSGWHTVRYDDLVDGKYLYNRCHLIGWQLTAENANERNLVTGTRAMNTEGMLPFENEVADYVRATGGRVLYRATPVFEGDDLVCHGVQLEAFSLDDNGASVRFNVFCYNVQPGVGVDYATGESWRKPVDTSADDGEAEASDETVYVVNTNTGKFHRPDCSSVSQMKESNRRTVTTTREDLLAQGYDPCTRCNP